MGGRRGKRGDNGRQGRQGEAILPTALKKPESLLLIYIIIHLVH